MTLLRDIQDSAVSSTTPVTDLLRRCKLLAARLGSVEFGAWVDHELSGYPSKDTLPPYRILRVESLGNFAGPAGSGMKNAPIPAGCLPKEIQDWARTEYLLDGVSVYEQLLRKENDGTFRGPWPADLVATVGQDIYEFMNCVQAWKVIPRGAIVGLTDAIRNRVLGFAIEIERANPAAGEASVNSSPVPAQVLRQVFNTQVYGNVGNFASGSTNVSQSAELKVTQGDIGTLEHALHDLGVTQADVEQLRTAIREDQRENAPGLGKRAAVWIGEMIGKAASGAWNVSISTASTVLPKLVSQYLGLPSGD